MEAINFLEYLASNAHHRRAIDPAQQNLSCDIQEAIRTNNTALLKQSLGRNNELADMTRVFA